MNLSAFSLVVDAVFVVLLVVTIVYAIKLNARISDLRTRETELHEMVRQFNQASDQALGSIQVLKTAGLDADREIQLATARAREVRDDLASLIDRGKRTADRLEHASSGRVSAPQAEPRTDSGAAPGRTRPESATGGADEYRSEIEQALAQVIRSTAAAG
jgi:hypothetical protein